MLPLYQIANQYREILSQADQPDISLEESEALKQCVEDTLESLNLDDQFNDKALAVACFTKELEAEAQAVKQTEETLRNRRKRLEIRANWMRDYLLVQLQKVQKSELKNDQIVIKLRSCPPKIVVDSEALIPSEFKEVETTIKICKSKMLEQFRNGTDTIPGVHVETGLTLSLR